MARNTKAFAAIAASDGRYYSEPSASSVGTRRRRIGTDAKGMYFLEFIIFVYISKLPLRPLLLLPLLFIVWLLNWSHQDFFNLISCWFLLHFTLNYMQNAKQEAEFLATLSQAPQPSGRRHSVVTISKVPLSVFGRGRRESVAAYPTVAGSRYVSPIRTRISIFFNKSTMHKNLCFIHNLAMFWSNNLPWKRPQYKSSQFRITPGFHSIFRQYFHCVTNVLHGVWCVCVCGRCSLLFLFLLLFLRYFER